MPNDWGVPPKNFGRFIPCRGGGTATTYYTDYHDVDENLVTIPYYGGHWNGGWSGGDSGVGIAGRNLHDSTAITSVYVASRLIYLS